MPHISNTTQNTQAGQGGFAKSYEEVIDLEAYFDEPEFEAPEVVDLLLRSAKKLNIYGAGEGITISF